MLPYASDIPSCNRIPRFSNLSPFQFSRSWTNKPFILTEPVKEWPAYRDWSLQYLLKKFGQIEFRAEAVDWPLNTYMDYMNGNEDESPLYLFDRSFVEKMCLNVGEDFDSHYWMPKCFGEDLFATLASQRPDSRWLILGPERSGSTFHKDPNATRCVHLYIEIEFSDFHKVPGTLSFVDQNIGSCFPHFPPIHLLLECLYQMIKAK